MKKISLVFVLIALLCGAVFAADTYIVLSGSGRALPSTQSPLTMLSSVKDTGASTTTYSFGAIAPSKFTCSVVISGTTPTAVVVSLDGSLDGTTWGALSTTGNLTASTLFSVVDKPVYVIRGNLVTNSTSSADTAVTMNCLASQ